MEEGKDQILLNEAFVDGQNLYLGITTAKSPWRIDLYRFREYLRQKYKVGVAYYFIGCVDPNNQDLYDRIQDAGFYLVFREHNGNVASRKKGNVDTDIVFMMMRDFHKNPRVKKFFLVSGDGDYYKTVRFLCDEGKLGKVLFPARRKASSLYHQLDNAYYDYLDRVDIRKKIGLVRNQKRGSSLR